MSAGQKGEVNSKVKLEAAPSDDAVEGNPKAFFRLKDEELDSENVDEEEQEQEQEDEHVEDEGEEG